MTNEQKENAKAILKEYIRECNNKIINLNELLDAQKSKLNEYKENLRGLE